MVILARDGEELDRAAQQLRQERGGDVIAMGCDVSDRHDGDEAVGRIEREVGPLHAVFVVAGVIQVGPVQATALDDYVKAIDIMTLGPVNVALTALPHLRRRARDT